jgi:very-short-patch-repair endonuclease
MQDALERAQALFEFLKELQNIRSPFPLTLEQYTWEHRLDSLPTHPEIKFVGYSDDDSDYVLCVGRPKIKPPPALPDELKDWITSETAINDLFSRGPTFRESRQHETPAGVVEVAFTDDERRVRAGQDWLARWRTWAEAERPARQALRVFEEFYGLKGRLDREGDRFELVLGDGILSWQNQDTAVYHPILLQRVQLEFDANKPEFRIVEADSTPELYGPAVRAVGALAENQNQNVEADLRKELGTKEYHPLAPETDAFYNYAANRLSAKGQFIGAGFPKKDADTPTIGRSAALFLRPRSQGFSRAIVGVLEVLPKRIDTLVPLQRVVGVEKKDASVAALNPASHEPSIREWDVQDVLLSKPANREQLLVVKNMQKHSGTVVQGPPGTGKTHTIANLIGHLLAQGKSILVTAHTAKALRVLRNKVAPELQPLCVSVLDNDQESRRQLEDAVAHIAQRLGEGPEKLEKEAPTLAKTRDRLLTELAEKRQHLIEALGGEYREVVAAGKGFAPSEAARLVRQYKEESLDWIPGRISWNTQLPLSLNELEELYRSNVSLNLTDEAELRSGLPELEDLPSPPQVEEWCKLIREPVVPGSEKAELWHREPSLDQLKDLSEALKRLLTPLQKNEPWQHAVIMAGSDPHLTSWRELINQIEATWKLGSEALELSIRYAPSLPADLPPSEQVRLAGEIVEHLRKGGKLDGVKLLLKPKWKAYAQKARVISGKPKTLDHFLALWMQARLREERQQLIQRWTALVVTAGGHRLDSPEPEKQVKQLIPLLEEGLRWYSELFQPFQHRLKETGFDWDALLRPQPPNFTPTGELLRWQSALEQLDSILRAKWVRAQQALGEKLVKQALGRIDPKRSRVSAGLARALELRSPSDYADAYKEAQRLQGLMSLYKRRLSLLKRLGLVAPDWAQAIEKRERPHESSAVPKEPKMAWLCRLLAQELDARSAQSIHALQAEIAEREKLLLRITAELIECKAWSAQLRKTSLDQQQALLGWLNTIKKIGKGKGKKVPELKAKAAQLMTKCRSAVPVWIMPLARVVEQFAPESDLFDVMIVDEASQTDLFGLILLAMARRIVVVGDNEQVSPLAVGEKVEEVAHLQHLLEEKGVPNAHLYDGKRSIYDIADGSFRGLVRLREHFRSVPEIIQFSNMLCYNGRINPLRESGHSHLKPAVRAIRVNGYREGDRNPVEAREIGDIIKRCIADPMYAGKTMGVISMVGEDQALLIEQMLRQEISPVEWQDRRLLCGNAGQFQGDERDVMFLSLVDVSEGTPLPLRDADLWRQRFNVAASRARDQMWVVYSLDPAVDLKPGDLRRLLIEHALNPERSLELLKVEGAKTESPFEREVLEHLARAGYRVRAQWPVGAYRIDLVVEGAGKRIAVECDGDRFHPPEKWEEDLERQRILERLGWQFIRIRGSSYYRDPITTMEWLFSELKELGVTLEVGAESTPQTTLSSNMPINTEVESHLKTMQVMSVENNQPLRSDPSAGGSAQNQIVDSSDFASDTLPPQSRDGVVEGHTSLRPSRPTRNTSSQQNELAPEDQARIKLVLATDPDLWFELARWAKERGHFAGWERKLIFGLGIFVKRGHISYKQARQAVRLLEQARQYGFRSSKAGS